MGSSCHDAGGHPDPELGRRRPPRVDVPSCGWTHWPAGWTCCPARRRTVLRVDAPSCGWTRRPAGERAGLRM